MVVWGTDEKTFLVAYYVSLACAGLGGIAAFVIVGRLAPLPTLDDEEEDDEDADRL